MGRLVICFIRGRWCPFCVGQMEAMNLALPQIEQVGATLVAISPQTVKQSFLMYDQHKLRFPLLSDAGNKSKVFDIRDVASTLGVGFDCTMVALVESAILVFLLHLVQEREEGALNSAGDYTLRNLINRLFAAPGENE